MDFDDPYGDSDISNLPPEAWAKSCDPSQSFEPDDFWLRHATPEQQAVAMRAWFLSRYCDPAHETPYNGREGGHLFVNGGPYNPADELSERFSGIVDDELIEEVVGEFHSGVGDQWAPLRWGALDDYDEDFGLEVIARAQPLTNLNDRLRQAKAVLNLAGDPQAKQLAERLVFGAAIAALETFLWEVAHYLIDSDEDVLRDVVTKLPVFAQEQIKLGDLFKRLEGLKSHVMAYLQNLVWHRWDQVVPLYKVGLGIQLPSMKPFEAALVKRHDIVHRSGHDKSGNPITVTAQEIDELCTEIEKLAKSVDASLQAKYAPDPPLDDPGGDLF